VSIIICIDYVHGRLLLTLRSVIFFEKKIHKNHEKHVRNAWAYFRVAKGRSPSSLESIFKELVLFETHFRSFYNEIKSRVAVNIELGFLSGTYLVKNEINHMRNFQNTNRC
jgi:hypothetical protein